MATTDADDEYFWERLLQAIESGKVVPIVGRDALQVDTPEGLRPYEHLLARQLAAALHIDTTALPEFYDLNDIVCRAANFRGAAPQDYMTRIVQFHQSVRVQPPQALRLLARIPRFELFVSLTFDTLLEQAVEQARGRAPLVVSYPSATDHADYDPALLTAPGASLVFQLLGRCSPLRRFAVTEGQVLEGLHAVMANENRPKRLIDRLRDSHLLLLGAGLPDWPTRFLLRMARPGPLWNDRETDEIVAEASQDGLPTFLHRFSPEHSLTYRSTPLEFAQELERRWFERHPERPAAASSAPAQSSSEGGETASTPTMDNGAIFLSYAREDRTAAFHLAKRLSDEGIDVWVDHRLEPGDAYRRIIERNIANCSAFVALLSASTQEPSPRWYRREWSMATEQNRNWFGTGNSFIVPVIVDGSSSRDHAETLSLFGAHGTHAAKAPGGEPDDTLLLSLNRAQRQWRKQHAARA